MTPKLTPAQLSVIKRMKEGEILRGKTGSYAFCGFQHSYGDGLRKETVKKLEELGFIERVFTDRFYYTYELTAKGREIEL